MEPRLYENVSHQMRSVGILRFIYHGSLVLDLMHGKDTAEEDSPLPAAAFFAERAQADNAYASCLPVGMMETFRRLPEKKSAVRAEQICS